MSEGAPSVETPIPVEDLVTVVIPAKDEEASIGACLDSVLAQRHRNLQVIVVDGASTDSTARVVQEVAARDARVTLLRNARGLIPISLNMALAAATGKWLVRVDAHATVPEDYVSRAVSHLKTGQWGGVGGRKDGVGVTPAGRAVAAAMRSKFGVGNSTYHYGTELQAVEHVPFGAYPVALARELGGWDETLAVNQDFEFDYRVRMAGNRILFDPALTIDWECRQSLRQLFDQYRRYGHGKVAVAMRHPQSVALRHLMAPTLIVVLAISALTALRSPKAGLALTAPYAGGIAVASVLASRELPRRSRLLLPGAFATMHIAWGLGFWAGIREHVILRGRRESGGVGPGRGARARG